MEFDVICFGFCHCLMEVAFTKDYVNYEPPFISNLHCGIFTLASSSPPPSF